MSVVSACGVGHLRPSRASTGVAVPSLLLPSSSTSGTRSTGSAGSPVCRSVPWQKRCGDLTVCQPKPDRSVARRILLHHMRFEAEYGSTLLQSHDGAGQWKRPSTARLSS